MTPFFFESCYWMVGRVGKKETFMSDNAFCLALHLSLYNAWKKIIIFIEKRTEN